LAAWGFTAAGARVLLHLMAGSKEDAETVSAFFQDMRARGLGDPLLVVSDGAPGIIRAIETCFPRSARQRCLAHRMRNLAAKTPEPGAQPELRLPGDGPHRLWRRFQPGTDLVCHACREAVTPGSLDQHAAGTAIAGLGDTTALDLGAARVLRRHQAQPRHQLARVGEAAKVADLGHQHYR
jgi:Transposase, Mutator family